MRPDRRSRGARDARRTRREAEVEQRVRAGVEPVVRESEGSADVDDGVAEWLRHRAHLSDTVRRPRSQDVEILGGRTWDELAQDEIAATDEDDLVVQPTSRQQLAEGD